ncbi:MAG: hypothetical protein NTU62_19290 [Spirochaetes bacterium]|nr:hypothetical protein [Spirochaetota bacterium]
MLEVRVLPDPASIAVYLRGRGNANRRLSGSPIDRLAGERKNEAREAADAYLNELTVCLPVDRMVAELAWQLKEAIAATARAAGAVLVHATRISSGFPGPLSIRSCCR